MGTPAVIDVEGILGQINKQDQEAVLIFKEDTHIQVFYFLNGHVRDIYFVGGNENRIQSDLKKQVMAIASKDNIVRIELFDITQVSAATDREEAEQYMTQAKGVPPQVPEEDLTNKAAYVQTPPPKTPENTRQDDSEKEINPEKNPPFSDPDKKNATPLWVKVLGGSRAGFLIRFSADPVSLGRGNVAVRLNDPQVSRFHAELAWGKDGLFIRDNHSTNGIFVNDEKVYRKTLILNDIIRLGDVRLKVVAGS